MTKTKAKRTELTVERVLLDSLREDPNNVRKHTRRNLDMIKESLKRFGQMKNIVVDSDGVVKAGNGTIVAMRELVQGGLSAFNTVTVHRSSLKGDELMAFAIADNRSSELAEWDYDALSAQLASLTEFNLGFDPNEISAMSLIDEYDGKEQEQANTTKPHKVTIVCTSESSMDALIADITPLVEKHGAEIA